MTPCWPPELNFYIGFPPLGFRLNIVPCCRKNACSMHRGRRGSPLPLMAELAGGARVRYRGIGARARLARVAFLPRERQRVGVARNVAPAWGRRRLECPEPENSTRRFHGAGAPREFVGLARRTVGAHDERAAQGRSPRGAPPNCAYAQSWQAVRGRPCSSSGMTRECASSFRAPSGLTLADARRCARACPERRRCQI